ncbi:MAG: molybdopterin oxidoreductase, partial [Actinobacteria bacterium]|nr:molybdopterin oxidoreductase [Actinomycetota bacterium]
LAPAGLTFAELREVGWLPAAKVYRRHEEAGFATPSGKVELSSGRLSEWGFDGLPACREPARAAAGEPVEAAADEEFPLLLTSWKPQEYYHSSGRHIPLLRAAHPRPLAVLHPDTAAAAGIGEGDPIVIATRHGQMTQTATLSGAVDPRVVIAEPGWWFPEQGPERLYGWLEANLNVLTGSERPYCREMGATTLRGIGCRVVRADG